MKRSGLLLLCLAFAGPAVAEDDPLLVAARAALAGNQPLGTLNLLRDHPGLARMGAERLLVARAQLALGRGDQALAALATGDAAALSGWPSSLRGAVALCVGEARLQRGDDQEASTWIALAARTGGDGVAIDRCLALLIELARRLGDRAAERVYAEALWQGWARSPWQVAGGLALARLLAEAEPDLAREVLAGVLQTEATPSQRLAAAELLCHLLLARRPGQCLVVAERELRRGGNAGRLPLYRALALVELRDPAAGGVLRALPAVLAADPAVAAARQKIDSRQASADGESAGRRERARAALELGQPAEALALIRADARADAEALALLAAIPDSPLDDYLEAPALAHPLASFAVGRALVERGRQVAALPLLRRSLTVAVTSGIAGLSVPAVRHWTREAARVVDPGFAEELRVAQLRESGSGSELGQAWCEEAQRLAMTAERDAEDAAWRRAVAALPAAHPWRAGAVWRVARRLLGQDGELSDALAMLTGPAWDGDGEDAQRCRFLLAQVLSRLGRSAEALHAAESLRRHAVGSEQRQRLEQFIARLQAVAPPPP